MPETSARGPSASDDDRAGEQLASTYDRVDDSTDSSICGEPTPHEFAREFDDWGNWPSWWRKLLWDIFPWKQPKRTDGLEIPKPKRPYWLDEPGSCDRHVLDVARETRMYAERELERVEARSSRLLQTALALLAVCYLSTAFLLNQLLGSGQHSRFFFLLLVPSGVAIVSFTLSALQALGTDRVGLGIAPRPGPVAETGDKRRVGVAAHEEAESALITGWTSFHKLSEANKARRWLSRGIAALMLSGGAVLVAIFFLG